MKIRNFAVIFIICISLSACGIAHGTEPGQTDAQQNSQTDAQQNGQTGEKQNEQPDEGEEGKNSVENPQGDNIRKLTQEELQKFTDFINEEDNYGNYGFLLSIYDKPADIYLDEVFYTGAGIATTPSTEEEKQAYLKANQQAEIYTDLVRITKPMANEFLMKKTGLSYDEMNRPLTWIYLEEFDAFYAEHGDTNYRTFTCIEGTVLDEVTFTLRFSPDEDNSSYYHSFDCETVLKKQGDSLQFVSNRLIEEEGLIEEQSFTFNMAVWGEVTFAAYEPDIEKNPKADVTYLIMHGGNPLIQLQGTDINNLCNGAPFQEIKAVSFKDYNGDGITDIIIIAEYGENIIQSRAYAGNSYGYFYFDQVLYGLETVKEVIEELNGESGL